ncbi:ROK family protein [Nocardia cyriacigeorgica]|uniref:ROK family protein n=1 Tax=Nocardia cyriacigeorgica TaxID=135487 RepID=UPI0002E639EF|nr:ROK family protein [Nocardia cyriacigeorgica]TLF55275.1 ROK family protein [Nocardia cyriacigeorgica]
MTILALEIGADRFAAVQVADGVGADEIRTVPVPDRAAWDRCAEILLDAAEGGEVTGVGIASIGPIDMSAGVVAPAHVAEWRMGFGIVEAVQKLFPQADVQLALDGVCLALAEQQFGATAEVMDALSMRVSDQVSGGVMVGGFVVVGRTGNAGHIGHVLVPGFDDPCECGGRGCLAAVAGGRSLLRWAADRGWSGASLEALVEAAGNGEDVAVAAISRAGTALGRAISSVAALLDIDLVVIGGTVAEAGPVLWKPLGEAIATHARLTSLSSLRAIPSELGAVGVIAGAGVLALSAVSSGD